MFNPIVQQSIQTNLTSILNGVRSGTIDARQEVLKLISNMSEQQKQQFRNMLPKVQGFAQQRSIPFENEMREINAHL